MLKQCGDGEHFICTTEEAIHWVVTGDSTARTRAGLGEDPSAALSRQSVHNKPILQAMQRAFPSSTTEVSKTVEPPYLCHKDLKPEFKAKVKNFIATHLTDGTLRLSEGAKQHLLTTMADRTNAKAIATKLETRVVIGLKVRSERDPLEARPTRTLALGAGSRAPTGSPRRCRRCHSSDALPTWRSALACGSPRAWRCRIRM